MEYAAVGVFAIVVIVAVSAFSKQLGIAAPLLLVVAGLGFSFIPGAPTVDIPPWIILDAVLPPLLYASAVQVPLVDFRRNVGRISALSVLLVIVTSFGVGFVMYALIGGLDLGAAIALGAVVSPTDVVAATTIARRLGLPARLITTLEGEGLVNDASALVMLKSAIAASGAGLSLLSVAGEFALSVSVAIVIGLAAGVLTVWVRSTLRDPILDTAISFTVPFIAFIPADMLNASGLLAAVVAGIYSGHRGASLFTAQTRLSERLNWRTVQFLLENGVFLLMGLELKAVITKVPDDEFGIGLSVLFGLLVCVVLLVVRALFVVPIVLQLQRAQRRASRNDGLMNAWLGRIRRRPDPTDDRGRRRARRSRRFAARREADNESLQADSVDWRGGVVLTWAGMRGVVTLAAAQSLPADTPYRPQLVLIGFTVAVFTLLVQGGSLPMLIKRIGIRGSDVAADRRSLAALVDEMSAAGLAALDEEIPENNDEKADPEVIERVRQDTLLRSAAAWERAERAESDDPEAGPHHQYRALRMRVLAAEREAVIEARSRGSYPSRVLTRAQNLLDAEEARVSQGVDGA
ncbi:sodium:proton antiporter [Microbacterium sp. STN6]|uniref:cation:proton antiporter n=1 Tax=Microbacterium sp. STN6 TaxID=2995588 RepID=UPI002260ABED|nr:sodium:proton antiporter [Microbacterium sp. STN6]MCX7522138.1 sodium:proton antiporter [Microbacterium sp. STN6]